MRAAPTIQGRSAARFAWLVFGLCLCAGGIVCFLESELGLPPWDVLHQGLGVRIALVAVALPLFGVGSAFYICASMGAGPRDSLMLVASRRLGVRIGAARTGIEIAALAIGFALGGTAGIGTLVFALGIGPAVEISFWLLERTPLAAPAVASAPA